MTIHKINLSLLFASLMMISGHEAIGQNEKDISLPRHKIGFIYGQGDQSLLNVKYRYRVKFFQFQYFYVLKQKPNWSIDLLVQPQFNMTRFRYQDNIQLESNGYEYGVNFGILLRKNMYKDILSSYASISFGPHYVSGAPSRQTSGFIFSDNVFIGLTVKLDKNIYFDLRPGFRHISNANLVKPNRGVNNMMISGGIIVNLDQSP